MILNIDGSDLTRYRYEDINFFNFFLFFFVFSGKPKIFQSKLIIAITLDRNNFIFLKLTGCYNIYCLTYLSPKVSLFLAYFVKF